MSGPRGYRAVPDGPVRRSPYLADPPRPPSGPGGGSRITRKADGFPAIVEKAPYVVPPEWPTYVPHECDWDETRTWNGTVLHAECRDCGRVRR